MKHACRSLVAQVHGILRAIDPEDTARPVQITIVLEPDPPHMDVLLSNGSVFPIPLSRLQAADPPAHTLLQKQILAALDGVALRTSQLANACHCSEAKLFRRGGLKELRAAGQIEHSGVYGYFRTDAPPEALRATVKCDRLEQNQ